jgi:subtilisin family serine protease
MKALTLLSLTCLAAESLALSLPGGGLFARQQCSAYTVTNELPYEAATGLHQLSHSDLPAGGLTDANSEYIFHPISGSGTCAWSIDTGVKPDHNEYFGRLLGLWDCIGATARLAADPTLPHHGCIEVQAPYPPGFDGNGHGTHTAATILGTQYGAAPSAKLVGVKVLNAQGGVADFKDIAAAVRFAADHAKELSTGDNAPCFRGTACNLSLGIGLPIALLFDPSSEVRKAVDAAADAGLFCAVAAGNSDLDTSLFVPASAPKACTVGALDEKNVKACFSNKGGLVDVWATGVNVLSAGIADEESTVCSLGTSASSTSLTHL